MGKCADYQNYVNPLLFPKLVEIDSVKKKISPRRIEHEKTGANCPEQLTLDLLKRA